MKISNRSLRKLIREELERVLLREAKNIWRMPLLIMSIVPTEEGDLVSAAGLGNMAPSQASEMANRVKAANVAGEYQDVEDLKKIAELSTTGGFFVFRVPSGTASTMFIKSGPHVAKGGLAGFIDADTGELDSRAGGGAEYISANDEDFMRVYNIVTDDENISEWARTVKVDPADAGDLSTFIVQLPSLPSGVPTPVGWLPQGEPSVMTRPLP